VAIEVCEAIQVYLYLQFLFLYSQANLQIPLALVQETERIQLKYNGKIPKQEIILF
jgi:hypothetical protein